MTQGDYFQEVKRFERKITNDTFQTAKKSTKPVSTSAAVKLTPKAVLTQNFFTPFKTTNMGTVTTGAENALPEQEAPRKSGRPPPIMMTFTYHKPHSTSEQLKRAYKRRV
jgi:hypothetical protein